MGIPLAGREQSGRCGPAPENLPSSEMLKALERHSGLMSLYSGTATGSKRESIEQV
jgi:hypothetical protein